MQKGFSQILFTTVAFIVIIISGVILLGIHPRIRYNGSKRVYPTLSISVTLPPHMLKFSPSTEQLLQQIADDTQINVSIGLNDTTEAYKRPIPGISISQEELDKTDKDRLTNLKQHMKVLQKGIIEDIAQKGGKVTYASELSPSVYATLSKRSLLEMVNRPDVQSIEELMTIEPPQNF